jgi:hypothetical protein
MRSERDSTQSTGGRVESYETRHEDLRKPAGSPKETGRGLPALPQFKYDIAKAFIDQVYDLCGIFSSFDFAGKRARRLRLTSLIPTRIQGACIISFCFPNGNAKYLE